MTIDQGSEKYNDIPASGKEEYQNTFKTKAVELLIELYAAEGRNPIEELPKIDKSDDGMYAYMFELVNNDSFWSNDESKEKNLVREKMAELVSKRFMGKEVRKESRKGYIESANERVKELLLQISELVGRYNIPDIMIDTDVGEEESLKQLESLENDNRLWEPLQEEEISDIEVGDLQLAIRSAIEELERQRNYKS